MRQRVVASDRKLVCLASTVTRHEYIRIVVSRNFEHVTHLIGDSRPAPGFRTGKVNSALPTPDAPVPNPSGWTSGAAASEASVDDDPDVWSGRALQENFAGWR